MQRNSEAFRQDFAAQEGEHSKAERHTPGFDKLGASQGLVDKTVIAYGRHYRFRRLTKESNPREHALDTPPKRSECRIHQWIEQQVQRRPVTIREEDVTIWPSHASHLSYR